MRFVAIMSCAGPLRTGYSHGFQFSVSGRPVDVVVRTLIEYDDAGWHYRGLRVVATTEAGSVDEAAPAFESAAESLLGVLSGVAAANTGSLLFHLIYADVPPGETGEMVIYSHRAHSYLRLHKAFWQHLQALYLGMANAGESGAGRIDRSLRWYRAAALSEDPIDRFTAAWIALESLNVLMERKWGLTSPDRLCDHCGKTLGKRHGLHGVEKLLTDIPEGGEATERQIRKMRNTLLHSTADARVLASEAAALSDVVLVAVLRGIAKYLDWKPETEGQFARRPLPPRPPWGAQAILKFKRLDETPLGVHGFHPFGELHTEEKVSHAANGEPSGVSYSASIRLVGSSSFQVEHRATQVFIGIEVGQALPAGTARFKVEFGHPPVPEPRGKGVTLWELGTDDPWYPDPRAAV